MCRPHFTFGVVFLVLIGTVFSQTTYIANPISGVFRPNSCEYVQGATQDTCTFETGIGGDASFSGANANRVTWGLEAGNGLSSLTWQPVVSAQLVPGVVTLVGRMRHTNRPIDGDNDDLIPTAVHWDLDIGITVSPGGNTFQYSGEFKLAITETDNTPADPIVGCAFEDNWSPDALPYPWTMDLPCCPFNTEKEVAVGQDTINGPCSDKIAITLENDADQQTFTDGNTQYSLTLEGFRPTPDAQAQAIVDFFISQEKTSTDGYLFVSWTATCVDVADCDNGNPCTRGTCNDEGKCEQINQAGSCTNSVNPNECQKGSCLNGECSVISDSSKQGSLCGALINTECRRTECQSGTCVDLISTYNGNSCTGPTPPECKRNICQAGICSPVGTAGGSCTGVTPTECTNAVCASGSCTLNNKADGTTCTQGSAGSCNKLGCSSGICTQIYDSSQLNTACTPPSGSSTNECKAYRCRPHSGLGTCTLRDISGSCTGLPALSCNFRTCSSGVCTYTQGTAGNCGNATECQYFVCEEGSGSYTCAIRNRPNSQNCESVPITSCTRGKCRSGTCSEVSRNNGNSCTTGRGGSFTGSVDDCNKPRCASDGNCVVTALSGTTCNGGAATESDCTRGSCSVGTCEVSLWNQGGSCSAGLGQSPLTMSSICSRTICSGITCIYSANAQANPKTQCTGTVTHDCNAYKCSSTNSTHSGTCTTTFVSASASGSCTSDFSGVVSASADRCKIRKCDGVGTCSEVNRQENQFCRNDDGAFCRDERCNALAVCVNVSANEGSTCNEDGVTPPASSDCYVNRCGTGVCKRENKAVGSDCRPSSNNRCSEYNCNNVGSCITSSSLANKTCSGFGPLASTLPAECRTPLCDGQGTCAYAAANEGDPCGTVSNLCKPKYCQASGQCSEEPLNVGDVCLNATVEDSCNQRRCSAELNCEPDAAFNGKACTPRNVEGVVTDFCGEFACDEGTCRTEAKNVDKICCPPGEEGQECEQNFQNPTNCTDEEGNKIPCDGGNFDSKCREFRCSEDGTCATVPLGTDVSCGNPGGFYCKEYTCDGRGHCDRANPKNITNAPCVGIDSSGIQTECQLFECDENAVCRSKIVAEGKECRNPQPTTNKRGIEDGIGPCEIARCNAFGRCELIVLEDGTGCNTPENEDDACWVGVCQDGECIETLTECQNDFLAGSSTFEGGNDDLCYYYYCDTVSGECVPDQNKSACSCAGCESCIKQREEDGIPCLWCSYRDPDKNSGTKCFHEDVMLELESSSSDGWTFECEGAQKSGATYTCPEGDESCQDASNLCGSDGNSLPFHWAYIVAAVAALASLGCIVCLLLAIAAALLLMIVKSATDTVAVIDTTGIAVNLKENPLYSNKYMFSENPLNH